MNVRVRLRRVVSSAWGRCLALARTIRFRWPSAEGWAAVAAIAAAMAAGFSLIQQQQAALDAIRPELVLSGWRVEIEKDANKFSLLFIDAVRNIGVGPAFRVLVYAPKGTDKRLTIITDVKPIAVLAKDEKVTLDATVRLAFKSESKSPSRVLPLEVHVTYSDLRGNRFQTVYNVLASELPIGLTEQLGPGVALRHRHTAPVSGRRWWWPFLWP